MLDDSKLATSPTTWEITTFEQKPITIDFAARLKAGDSLSATVPLRTMIDTQTGLAVDGTAFMGAASVVSTTIISQKIDGTTLRKGRAQYLFVAVGTITNGSTTRTEATLTVVDVPA